MDFNTELRQWVDSVANQRVRGTTREQVLARWDMDQFSVQLLNGRPVPSTIPRTSIMMSISIVIPPFSLNLEP